MKTKHFQRGVSLLELMISLLLGVLLLLGLGSIYQTAREANQDNEVLMSNSEAARQVFNRLQYDLKRAGFVDLYSKPHVAFQGAVPGVGSLTSCPKDSLMSGYVALKDGNHSLLESGDTPAALGSKIYGYVLANKVNAEAATVYQRWLDTTASATQPKQLASLDKVFMSPIGYISCGTMRPVYGCNTRQMAAKPDINRRAVCTNNGEGNSIEISYQAKRVGESIVGSELPEQAQDCTFSPVSDEQNGFVINRYFLKPDEKNARELSFACSSHAKENVTLVPGIQEMVFRYVTTVPETDSGKTLKESNSGSIVTSYKKPEDVAGTDLGWSGVVGVEVCLIVSTPLLNNAQRQSLGVVQGDKRPTCERMADGSFVANKDKDENLKNRFYQRYVRTFSLPNGLYAPIN